MVTGIQPMKCHKCGKELKKEDIELDHIKYCKGKKSFSKNIVNKFWNK